MGGDPLRRLEEALAPLVGALAAAVAAAGGLVLLALMVLTCVSITGRALLPLGLGPVPGDFELVELGAAFVVFSFLPWCQYRRGHVSVDLLIGAFGPRAMALAATAGNLLLTLAFALIAWRLWEGLFDKLRFGQSSFILAVPVWWAYAASVPGAVLAVAVSLFTALRSLNELRGAGEPAALASGE